MRLHNMTNTSETLCFLTFQNMVITILQLLNVKYAIKPQLMTWQLMAVGCHSNTAHFPACKFSMSTALSNSYYQRSDGKICHCKWSPEKCWYISALNMVCADSREQKSGLTVKDAQLSAFSEWGKLAVQHQHRNPHLQGNNCQIRQWCQVKLL